MYIVNEVITIVSKLEYNMQEIKYYCYAHCTKYKLKCTVWNLCTD